MNWSVIEAQEMNPSVFSELRLLSSADLDSRSILTIVLAGDRRLAHRLEGVELLPIASRIRTRLRTEPWRRRVFFFRTPKRIPN